MGRPIPSVNRNCDRMPMERALFFWTETNRIHGDCDKTQRSLPAIGRAAKTYSYGGAAGDWCSVSFLCSLPRSLRQIRGHSSGFERLSVLLENIGNTGVDLFFVWLTRMRTWKRAGRVAFFIGLWLSYMTLCIYSSPLTGSLVNVCRGHLDVRSHRFRLA